jgi:hypothetical protein
LTGLSPDGPTATGRATQGRKILSALIVILILLGTTAYLWKATRGRAVIKTPEAVSHEKDMPKDTEVLSGYVFDPDGNALQGAKVTIEDVPGVNAVETQSDGTFTIKGIPRKDGESVRVRVVKEGYLPNPYEENVVLGALLPPIRLSKEK